MKKALLKKGILLAASVLLLAAVVIYIATAWYTKNASISGVEFDVAQWDFNAVYQVDTATINVYTYTTLTNGKAAPGTEGFIPVTIDARGSDTDIQYNIVVDEETMSEEFQNRLTFYYGSDTDPAARTAFDSTHSMLGTLTKGSTKIEYIYWKWVYEMPDSFASGKTDEEKLALSQAWDEFDTLVGKDPSEYEPLMNATIKVYGQQVMPVAGN